MKLKMNPMKRVPFASAENLTGKFYHPKKKKKKKYSQCPELWTPPSILRARYFTKLFSIHRCLIIMDTYTHNLL